MQVGLVYASCGASAVLYEQRRHFLKRFFLNGKSGVPAGGGVPPKDLYQHNKYTTYMAHTRNVGDMFL